MAYPGIPVMYEGGPHGLYTRTQPRWDMEARDKGMEEGGGSFGRKQKGSIRITGT